MGVNVCLSTAFSMMIQHVWLVEWMPRLKKGGGGGGDILGRGVGGFSPIKVVGLRYRGDG